MTGDAYPGVGKMAGENTQLLGVASLPAAATEGFPHFPILSAAPTATPLKFPGYMPVAFVDGSGAGATQLWAYSYAAAAWRSMELTGTADTVALANGTAAAPSLSFVNSPTTGIYRSSADVLSVSIAGTESLRIMSTSITGPNGTSALTITNGLIVNGTTVLTAPASVGGSVGHTLTPGAHTAMTAEAIDSVVAAHTVTITGAITTQRFNRIAQATISAATAQTVTTAASFVIDSTPNPTGAGPATLTNAFGLMIGTALDTLPAYSASVATTITNGASLYVANAPATAGNVTVTNPYAIWVDDGLVRLDGGLLTTGGSGTTTQIGNDSSPTFSSAATTAMYGSRILVTGGTGTYATTTVTGLYVDTIVAGASQTVTTNTGITVAAQTVVCTTAVGVSIGAVSGGSSSNIGLNVTAPTGTGAIGVFISGGGITCTGTIANTGAINATTTIRAASGTAATAGGSTTGAIQLGSSGVLGIYFGSGAPSITAPKGSLYLRTDGTGAADRAYINTNSSTTWTAIATAG